MRRRPSAAYRVIDEEELLGAGACLDEADHGSEFVARTRHGSKLHRPRPLGSVTGWGSTVVAIVVLAGVAAVLFATSAHAPASSPPSRTATDGGRPQRSNLAVTALETVDRRPSRSLRRLRHRARPMRAPRRSAMSRHPAVPRHGTARRGSKGHGRGHRRQRRRGEAIRARVPRYPVAGATAAAPQPTPPTAAAAEPAAGPATEFGFER
jgi:hypothetical protein